MNPYIVLATVIAYVVAMVATARYAGRRADNNTFFLGNRSSNRWVVMLSMVGGAISGVTFVSVPGMVASEGFSYMQMAFGFMVGYLVIAYLLVPLFFRSDSVSIYEYLNRRFGREAYVVGAWLFFISKLLGASVRLFIACFVLQLLAFEPLGVPFVVNAALTLVLVLACTYRGGVKSVIFTDVLKTVTLIASTLLCTSIVAGSLGWSVGDMVTTIRESRMSQIFYTEDVNSRRYFFKQFLAGIFTVIAMTGLDQDMMQRSLACRTKGEAQRNLLLSTLLQTLIIFILLLLGVVLYTFAEQTGISLPEGADNMLPAVATSEAMPAVVGVLFVVGLIASTYSAAGSAMTALTTSFTIDILGKERDDDRSLARTRRVIHTSVAVAMFVLLCLLQHLNNGSVIDAVFTLASYTYGPILGIFAFGIFTPWQIRRRGLAVVAITAPLLCLVLQLNSERWFGGYKFGYELLIINALLTMLGMLLLRGRSNAARATGI
ncbi:MAG: sodium:solute symporter [Alistipes sp.]|nr:sodium:solute symporter [Alistipes sp.]